MQQTKRRSKKGVILLALAVALLVMAFVPALAAAAPVQLLSYDNLDAAQGQHSPPAGPQSGQWFGPNYNGGVVSGTWDAQWWLNTHDMEGVYPLWVDANVKAFAYKVDGLPINAVTFPVFGVAQPWDFTLMQPGLIRTVYAEGVHTFDHWAIENTKTVYVIPTTTASPPFPIETPITEDDFGWDSVAPVWNWGNLQTGADYYYGVGPVNVLAEITDPGGSGVAFHSLGASGPAGIGPFYFNPFVWNEWAATLSGTATASVSGTYPITYWGMDVVNNGTTEEDSATIDIKFDLDAPETSYKISPLNADTNTGWTNKDVTLTFSSVDDGGSGVDYTETITKVTSTTAPPTYPGLDESGVRGTTLTITETAPRGPVYVYYRSVDKAHPANKEAWKLVMVFIDKNAPMLEDDVPDWWINSVLGPFAQGPPCLWTLIATDPNSDLAPPGIWWSIEGHDPPFGGTNISGTAFINPLLIMSGLLDGIRNLNYGATDQAGNEASATAEIKIDTRAPVTDGAAGWVNGLEPYVLTAIDQVPGSGVAATLYRVDQKTPWSVNTATTVAPSLDTSIPWVAPVHGSLHTVDFASVDAALPACYDALATDADGDLLWPAPSWHYGNIELAAKISISNLFPSISLYKTRSVQLDTTAPTVTAMDPKNGNWQKGPAVVNFSGTDVGAGYAYTEWSTDGGTTWTKGEVASVGGDGEITVTYHGVDKAGIESADQTIVVKVASTHPTVTVKNAKVKKGHKAAFKFTVTSVTPTVQVYIQIRSKSGKTLSVHSYNNVTAGSQQSRSFKVNLKKGKYYIRIGAVDQAGNVQTRRGRAILTVR